MKRLIVCCLLVWSIAYQVDADTNGTINVNGVDRNFVYAVSAYPAPATGRPLVIHLHGNGGNMGLSAAWKQAVLKDPNGAVLLSAQGRNNIPAAGCYTVQVSSLTEQTLAQPIGGKTVKTYAYSQAGGNLATRCANLDLTFYIVQGGGHVPGGFEPTAWCFLSTVGGTPSTSACQLPSTHRPYLPSITREER
jgi:hypothetical protein